MKPDLTFLAALFAAIAPLIMETSRAAEREPFVPVAAQPLAANVTRLIEALDFLGASLPADAKNSLAEAAGKLDAERLLELLDEHVLFIVELNAESQIKLR